MDLQVIQNRIYEIRGCRVMLDFDLAERYQVSTKALKQAVKRNLQRFPEDFMFEMNSEEWEILRSQIVTSSWGGTRYMPFVFTEQGVAMLSSVLRSEIAIEVNISIMRAFVKMRELSSRYSELNQKLETFMIDTNIQFNEVYQALTELASKKESEDKPRKKVGFVKDE
ncbi:ORF6N domain-containing protein [Dysgonomonas mossii]|uniref:ORF6N domain-containing protein n=1 Tax=Dysgonomonas mossii TaxID=163665 RepID=A0A4Y9IKD3_9BACT|nr:ORF6N domain-containing protein [Dysgonomonas mossii]MBF0761370.1 ORF6N domain-containing protein [Dysgonomonas mossii]TFU89007.1 ORF6N domain-containing protein [Dysgonomonas mossii]